MPPGRILALVVALLSTSLAGAVALAGTKATAGNSVEFEYGDSGTDVFEGTDCGTTASVTHTLPRGARQIRVAEPDVGNRDDFGGTRVTEVAVKGEKVTITVLADGPSICDPEQTGVPEGEPVEWTARYDYRARYKRRVVAKLRVYYESYLTGARWKVRPKTVHDTRKGGPPGLRVTGIRWKRFGGKTAVGTGRMRLDYCRPGDNCPDDGRRMRLKAAKPGYCTDSGKIEYLKLTGYLDGRLYFGARIDCY